MKILLDTSTFLWLALDAPELSARAREVVLDSGNEVFLSAVSAWEIAVKNAIGRLPLPEPAGEYIRSLREKLGVDSLPLDEESALHIVKLPELHGDPFDRMLICQALVHGLTVLTPDRAVTQYPVRALW